MAACHPRRREAAAAPIFSGIYDIESAVAWWWRRGGGGGGGMEAANDFFLVFKNFCEKFTVTNATRIPLGPQRGNSNTHLWGPCVCVYANFPDVA